jgi:septal ring factor EnvC (AmiA/AmiB activator)
METWQTIVSIALPLVSIVGLILTAIRMNSRQRHTEIAAAEERGKMLQRLQEVEEDVTHAHDKLRTESASRQKLEREVSEISAKLDGVKHAHEATDAKIDRLIELHINGTAK